MALRNGKITLLLLDPTMRAIVFTRPSSIVALILLVTSLQAGLLAHDIVSEVRLSVGACHQDPGLSSAKERRIGRYAFLLFLKRNYCSSICFLSYSHAAIRTVDSIEDGSISRDSP